MSLLNLNNVSFSWNGDTLLKEISLNLNAGEHVGLVGRNGCGKSTLLKLMANDILPEHGEVRRAKNLRITRLMQEVPAGNQKTVAELIGDQIDLPEEEI